MAHFLISYDLHKVRNYQPLWDRLANQGAVRLLESLWVVSLESTAGAVRDNLQTVIDQDDSLAVIELKAASGWATRHGRKSGVEWLQRNILA